MTRNFSHEGANGEVTIREGDARDLKFLADKSIDLICTHPPYANIIHYSEGQNLANDLSNLDVKDFLGQMKLVASECFRVLKKGKFCAILMGDTRKKGHIIPMSTCLYSKKCSSGKSRMLRYAGRDFHRPLC